MANDFEVVPTPPRTATTYQFGVRLAADTADVIAAQARLSHETYNAMIEVCRATFDAVMAHCRASNPAIIDWEQQIEVYRERRRTARAADDRAEMERLATESRPLWASWRTAVWDIHRQQRQEINAILEAVNPMRKESALYRVRAAAVARGLYSDTATETMRRARTAFDMSMRHLRPPSFRPWAARLQDTLVLQVNDRPGGLTVADLHGGGYRRLWIGQPPAAASRRRLYLPFRMRVAPSPDGPGRRGGIDATGTVFLHRDLPDDARITWARLVRRRTGSQWHTYLQLVAQLAQPLQSIPPSATRPALIAAQLNWRADADGRRVLAWSQDGDIAANVYLDDRNDGESRRADAYISERSTAANAIVARLRQSGDWSQPPDELAPLAAAMSANAANSPVNASRLAVWVTIWRQQQPQWQPELLAEAERWRRRDKTLWNRAANLRRKVSNRRDKQYQMLARRLADTEVLAINRPDLRAAARIKDANTDAHTDLAPAARSARTLVALSRLEHWVNAKAAETGAVVVRVSGRATWTCHCCGAEAARPLRHAFILQWTCPECGVIHDRDENAACWVWRTAAGNRDTIDAAAAVQAEKLVKTVARRAKMKEARTAKLRQRHRKAGEGQ